MRQQRRGAGKARRPSFGVCSLVSVHAPPRVTKTVIFGQAFFAGKPPLARSPLDHTSAHKLPRRCRQFLVKLFCGEAPAGKIAACSLVSEHDHTRVSAKIIFGQAFFKKLARWSRGGSALAAASESSLHGISFLQSFFLCAYSVKEKSVKRAAQPSRLPPEGTLQRAGLRRRN